MKLEDITCTYQQASKFKQLGFDQRSLFSWTGIPQLGVPYHVAFTETIYQEYSGIYNTVRKSAYNHAELLSMLQHDTIALERLKVLVREQLQAGGHIAEIYSAPFLAAQILELVSRKLLKVSTCNKHLIPQYEPG